MGKRAGVVRTLARDSRRYGAAVARVVCRGIGVAGSRPGPVAVALATLLLSGCVQQPAGEPGYRILSLVATNDVHGELHTDPNRGGLVGISGYVNALRAAHGESNVLLLDAGDMWQGSIESNLGEGAAVVRAYNAMGYAAAAIGNHEFDFGPVGEAVTARGPGDDPQGALKKRAREASFPLLGANIIDDATGTTVDWENVLPATVVSAAGIEVGIIGVTTLRTPQTTIAANLAGLRIAPLADTIRHHARKLRAGGVSLIVVVAHAGGTCSEFTDPRDLSSCNPDSEIFEVARALPEGLVDHIFAGHKHEGIAHVVNGISVSSGFSHTYAFSRVDFRVHPATGTASRERLYPPQAACPYRRLDDDACAWSGGPGTVPAVYEGYVVTPDPVVVAAADAAAAAASEKKRRKIGPYLETPFTLKGNPESALGNLMTRALLESADADVAIHNVSGGIRGVLPAGELDYGSVYEMFPFDNRAVVISLSGRELREVLAAQARRAHRRAGIAGVRVRASCQGGVLDVDLRLDDGSRIADDDTIRVVANDFLALGGDGILSPAMPAGGFRYDAELGLAREILVDWLATHERLHAEEFLTGSDPRWRVQPGIPEDCRLPAR